MKKLLLCLLLFCANAHAQFIPGQVLTASQLNAQFALKANLTGANFTGGISATGITGTPISGSTGSFSNLSASGTVTLPNASIALTNLANQAANTVLANVTAGSASPTAVAMPSCSTSASALNYTTSSGFSCNTAINASQLGGATFASPGSIGSTTPGSGAFTTLSSTGAFTPSQTNGIVGTTTNNNANAGSVGEFICAQVTNGGSPTGCQTNSSIPVSLTTNTAANVTSVSLTAGDWTCYGNNVFIPAGSTTISEIAGWISTTSAAQPTVPNSGADAQIIGTLTTGGPQALPVGSIRILVGSTTTVFLGALAQFGTSTMTAVGYIGCRRAR